MDPEAVRAWQRIIRDTVIVLVGAFMLLYETIFARPADWQIIAAALACFGLPPALRLDLRRDKEDQP